MLKILASIQNISEAKILINSDIDIIDLKDPSKGALGKLNINDIVNIINFIDKKKLTSSTIGDLPNNKKLISKSVDELSVLNIDFIKIGVYERSYINTLAEVNSCKKLIAVFFADLFLPKEKDLLFLKELNQFFTAALVNKIWMGCTNFYSKNSKKKTVLQN